MCQIQFCMNRKDMGLRFIFEDRRKTLDFCVISEGENQLREVLRGPFHTPQEEPRLTDGVGHSREALRECTVGGFTAPQPYMMRNADTSS